MKSLVRRGRVLLLWSAVVLTGRAPAAATPAEPPTPQAKDETKDEATPAEPKKAPEGPEEAGLPLGILARVDGRDITVKEYADYLLASIGKARLDEYIDRLLVEAAARTAGIVVEREAVEKLVEERIERTIRGIYRGSRDDYLKGLGEQETSLEERQAVLRQEIYYRELLAQLILKRRTASEDEVQAEFHKLYGPGGVQYELRHILVSTLRRTGSGGERLPVRTEAEARERAEKIHQELLAGADFAQLVGRYSDDTLTRRNDGRIPLYREGMYGEDLHKAVVQLSQENPLSGVVRSKRGFHLVELVKQRVTRLEDVRAEIEDLVGNRAPSPAEENETIRALRKAAKIVR